MDKYDDGLGTEEIRADLETQYAEYIADDDDGPIFWLAVAKSQRECGGVQPSIIAKVEEIINSDYTEQRWSAGGLLKERKDVLNAFLMTLMKPNPNPRQPGVDDDD